MIIVVVNKWKKANVFKIYRTGKTYKTFHQLTCKNKGIIYLLQYTICFTQYVGKSETTFNLRLNNHRKDSKKKDAIFACTHFQKWNHNIPWDAKLVLNEQITRKYNTHEELRLILKKRESFWILNLRALYPEGLTQELNDVWQTLSRSPLVQPLWYFYHWQLENSKSSWSLTIIIIFDVKYDIYIYIYIYILYIHFELRFFDSI